MGNRKTLLCTCCNSELVVTHQDRYQDLCEHVSQPNREPSMKNGYQCPNTECIANQGNVTWIEDGEYYIGKRPANITYTQLTEALKEKHGTSFAVNSWNYHYELGKNAIKARTKEYRIGKYRVIVSPKENGHSHPLEKQYQPKKIGWKFEWWKQGSEPGCWQHLVPIHRMVRHYLRSFESSYKSSVYNPSANRSQIKEALEYATGNRWGTKDDRSFAQISSFIIQTFKPNKVKTLIKLAEEHKITV